MIKTNFVKGAGIFFIISLFSLVGGYLNSSSKIAEAQTSVSVGIFASPDSLSCGGSTTLTWDSVDATEVTIEPGLGRVSNSGSRNVSPSSNTTYVITGTNSDGGYGSTSVTVDVNCNTYPSPNNYNYQSPYGTPSNYTYQTPTQAPAGTNTNFNSNTNINTINIPNQYGTPSNYSYQTPSGNNVTVNLTADDTSIDEGDDTTLRWNSTNATSCTASGGTNGWSGSRGTSGSFNTGDLHDDETYSITCRNNTNSANDTDTVTVRVDEDNNSNNDDAPDVETINATNINSNSATLNGRVDGNGCSTDAWFEYSDNRNDVDNDEQTDEESTGSGVRTFDERITGLRSNTTYYFRAVAENCEDEDTGSILSFYTNNFNVYPTPYITPVYQSPYQTPSTSNKSAYVLVSSSIDRNQPIVPVLDNSRPLPGDEITYTVHYRNVGNASVTNLTLQLNLPYQVDFMYSNPSNPTMFGNTLIFNLGTLKANGEGTVTVRVRVREDAEPGTILNFPAMLSYVDPSGNPQTVSANVSAEVWRDGQSINYFGANVFGAGFFPSSLLGWFFLIILLFVLAYLAKKIFAPIPVQRVETNTIHHV